MQTLYEGETVTSWDHLAASTGRDGADMIVGEDRRQVFRTTHDQLRINYGDNVEYQLQHEHVILCPQTVDFLYGDFVQPPRYERGARPQLEKIVAETTQGCKTDADKVLALMRLCRDLYKKRTGAWADYIYGGTEERLIEKGEQLCECLGRLMTALCEVAGFPGRIVMHNIGGHFASEILVDGRWGYIDPRAGFYCLDRDGRFLSTWEIWQNPQCMHEQSQAVQRDVSDRWTWPQRVEKCEQKYFHPLEVNGLINYSLADAQRYSYGQKTQQQAADDGLFVISDSKSDRIDRIFGLK